MNITARTLQYGRLGLPSFGIITKLCLLAVTITLWQLIVYLGIWKENLLPGPLSVLRAIYELYEEGALWGHINISIYRFISGYVIALMLALPLGIVLGWFTSALKAVNPILQIIRPVSPIAWFPFVVLWFGIGDAPAIAVITIAAFFPILFSTIGAISRIEPIYVKIASNFELTRIRFFYKMAIPLAFPNIMVGLHIAIGSAWIFLVAGEMVGAQSGLGYLIVDARNNIRMDMVMAGILQIGILGWGLDGAMSYAEKKISKKWGDV